MPRTSKRPEDRRNEILAVAADLFREKGFENTSVDDIVDRMHVAKGLFYYYFDSKEAMLEALVEPLVGEVHAAVDAVMAEEGLSALQRFRRLGESTAAIRARSCRLMAYFRQERNRALRYSLEHQMEEFMVPAMERTVRQGVEEGVFHTAYPKETALTLMAMFTTMGQHLPREDEAALVQWKAAMANLTERLLGAAPGTFAALIEEASTGLDRITS